MEYEIIMNKESLNTIQCLMSNIDSLVKGYEIGAWLLGKWDFSGEKLTLNIDKVHLPKQKISRAEVNIEMDSIRDMIQELGVEESNRLVGHWHIHPFNKGTTNWSSIDETKISAFMKDRELFCFLLSSLDQLKGRVEARIKTHSKLLNQEIVITESMDNLPIITEKDNTLVESLRARIEEKVTLEEPKLFGYYQQQAIGNNLYLQQQKSISKAMVEDPFDIEQLFNKKIQITLEKDFYTYLLVEYNLKKEIGSYKVISNSPKIVLETLNNKISYALIMSFLEKASDYYKYQEEILETPSSYNPHKQNKWDYEMSELDYQN